MSMLRLERRTTLSPGAVIDAKMTQGAGPSTGFDGPAPWVPRHLANAWNNLYKHRVLRLTSIPALHGELHCSRAIPHPVGPPSVLPPKREHHAHRFLSHRSCQLLAVAIH